MQNLVARDEQLACAFVCASSSPVAENVSQLLRSEFFIFSSRAPVRHAVRRYRRPGANRAVRPAADALSAVRRRLAGLNEQACNFVNKVRVRDRIRVRVCDYG